MWTKTTVIRLMEKLEASDRGMEKEDLRGQKGHPRETSNKTQGGELLPSVGAPLSINPGRAKD